MTQQFGYAVDRRYLPLLLPFRFRRDRDGVTVGDDAFEATIGFFRVTTARDNITGAHITRGYRWWTAFGVRGSMADDGLSFGTNHEAGVCIHFAEKVPSRTSRGSPGPSAATRTQLPDPPDRREIHAGTGAHGRQQLGWRREPPDVGAWAFRPAAVARGGL
jgi:hypothetical protein